VFFYAHDARAFSPDRWDSQAYGGDAKPHMQSSLCICALIDLNSMVFPACGSLRSPDNGCPSVPPWRVIFRMSKPISKTDEPSFEDAMLRLDEIVAGMEDGQLSLEEMISNYEDGVRLLKLCRQRIDGARRRVDLISADLEGGKATLTPFDDAADSDENAEDAEKPRSPARRRNPAENEGGEIRLF
jgi:exodeoxyribonuclease VII small subunit